MGEREQIDRHPRIGRPGRLAEQREDVLVVGCAPRFAQGLPAIVALREPGRGGRGVSFASPD